MNACMCHCRVRQRLVGWWLSSLRILWRLSTLQLMDTKLMPKWVQGLLWYSNWLQLVTCGAYQPKCTFGNATGFCDIDVSYLQLHHRNIFVIQFQVLLAWSRRVVWNYSVVLYLYCVAHDECSTQTEKGTPIKKNYLLAHGLVSIC